VNAGPLGETGGANRKGEVTVPPWRKREVKREGDYSPEKVEGEKT